MQLKESKEKEDQLTKDIKMFVVLNLLILLARVLYKMKRNSIRLDVRLCHLCLIIVQQICCYNSDMG